jgi:hypothetical protein
MTHSLRAIFTDAQLVADLARYNDAVASTNRQIADISKTLERRAQVRRRRLRDRHERLLKHRDELETEARQLHDILEGDA